VGNLAKRIRKLILPFAVAAKDRFKPLTKNMEMAAIFYFAERDRKKGEGRVLKFQTSKPSTTMFKRAPSHVKPTLQLYPRTQATSKTSLEKRKKP